MTKVRFLVTQTGDNQFKQLKKTGTMVTLSYAFHGQDQDGISIATTVTGPKEAVEKMFTAWPIAVSEHFFVDVISDPVTIAQALAAQAQAQGAGQKTPAKKPAKPASQPAQGQGQPPASGTAPTTPASGTQAAVPPVEGNGDDLTNLAAEAAKAAEEEADEEEDATEEENQVEEDA